MAGKRSGGLLVEAQRSRAAEVICRRRVAGVHIASGALLLASAPAWAAAINAVLVKIGVRADEAHRVENTFGSYPHAITTLVVLSPRAGPYDRCTGLRFVPLFTCQEVNRNAELIRCGDARRKAERAVSPNTPLSVGGREARDLSTSSDYLPAVVEATGSSGSSAWLRTPTQVPVGEETSWDR